MRGRELLEVPFIIFSIFKRHFSTARKTKTSQDNTSFEVLQSGDFVFYIPKTVENRDFLW